MLSLYVYVDVIPIFTGFLIISSGKYVAQLRSLRRRWRTTPLPPPTCRCGTIKLDRASLAVNTRAGWSKEQPAGAKGASSIFPAAVNDARRSFCPEWMRASQRGKGSERREERELSAALARHLRGRRANPTFEATGEFILK